MVYAVWYLICILWCMRNGGWCMINGVWHASSSRFPTCFFQSSGEDNDIRRARVTSASPEVSVFVLSRDTFAQILSSIQPLMDVDVQERMLGLAGGGGAGGNAGGHAGEWCHTPLSIHHCISWMVNLAYTVILTPLTIHHYPYTTYYTPVFPPHTPLTIHQYPHTTNHTPLTIHHCPHTIQR